MIPLLIFNLNSHVLSLGRVPSFTGRLPGDGVSPCFLTSSFTSLGISHHPGHLIRDPPIKAIDDLCKSDLRGRADKHTLARLNLHRLHGLGC